MSDACDWCWKGKAGGWPPPSKAGLCIECRTVWERDRAVAVLRALMGHEAIEFACDCGPRDEGWASEELSADISAAIAFLNEMEPK